MKWCMARGSLIVILFSVFFLTYAVNIKQEIKMPLNNESISNQQKQNELFLAIILQNYKKTASIEVPHDHTLVYEKLSSFIEKIMMDHSLLQEWSERTQIEKPKLIECLNTLKSELAELEKKFVTKKVLANGMTILVRAVHTLPKVSLQVWYHVGSKDEKTNEKGIAHLIEHMIFKGTKKYAGDSLELSESDINIITHMLSGSTNAFTSYDYTGYLFNLPVQHWHEALPILADCMQNVAFKEDHLNSEMKAVIQELKMGRDNYPRTLIFDLIGAIFPDHPYHFNVIGHKQDLFDVHAEQLRKFYKKHYWPNNATLVVVGDVDPNQVFELAEKHFEKIPADLTYKKEQFYFNEDIVSHGVTLYRDIQQPFALVAYTIPGAQSKNEHLVEVLTLILGSGKGSVLYRKLVDELHLVTSLAAFNFLFFEHGNFIIAYEPKNATDNAKIQQIIQEEIEKLIKNGITDAQVTRALKQARMNYYGLLESIESQAGEIGRCFLATGDENFAFHFLNISKKEIEEEIKKLLLRYFRPTVMHTGIILPLSENEKIRWTQMQKESDEYDAAFLAARGRTSPIEPPHYAKKVKVQEAREFDFPKYKTFSLSNGIKALYFNNKNTPKINLVLELKARPYYDDVELPGLYNFLAHVLSEGTKKYTAAQLADELESRGMSLVIKPGLISMSMLSTDLQKGLELLKEVLSSPRFDEKEIEKVREQILAEIKNFWDSPNQFSGQLIAQEVYKNHPYSKNILGTFESVKKITKKDLIEFHKKYISPDGARIAIVGDLDGYDLKDTSNKTLGTWNGSKVGTIEFPTLAPVKQCEITHQINRDQVVLCFAGLSVDRLHPDYDKLLLFDQIFGGGALGSLHSKLFQLREQSGLFYGISGSLVVGANEQPGMVMVKTLVSLDRLAEAEKAIKEVIENAINDISDQEFTEAKHAIINSMVNNFATNSSMAQVFLSLDKFALPSDYYDKRAELLSSITLEQMQKAVKKILTTQTMFTLKVGRLEKK